ncbi:MAG: hypothetical protein MRERV_56c006 [Mycoplasmataceae bacterium RV_VA103A]|nr:MAG: hypothetical protein MRERV_56c006 [Mycoplasmataceae bacterium RV_VA103A]
MVSIQEIKKYLKEITNEPNEEYVEKIKDVFKENDWLLKKLTDEQLKKKYKLTHFIFITKSRML